MPAAIVTRTDTAFTIQLEIPYASSMLEFEEVIQQHLNEAGVLATTEALQQFDADGSPISIGDTKLTSKGKLVKEYQTPYGVAPVERHVYQSSRGGRTYCPLDREARIVVSSTPKFARMVSHKYAEFGSARVIKDRAENHGRVVAQVIDFWHAAEYLSDAAGVLFARSPDAKRAWLESSCHRLKHEPGAARQLIKDLRRMAAQKGVSLGQEDVAAAITYFTNQGR